MARQFKHEFTKLSFEYIKIQNATGLSCPVLRYFSMKFLRCRRLKSFQNLCKRTNSFQMFMNNGTPLCASSIIFRIYNILSSNQHDHVDSPLILLSLKIPLSHESSESHCIFVFIFCLIFSQIDKRFCVYLQTSIFFDKY